MMKKSKQASGKLGIGEASRGAREPQRVPASLPAAPVLPEGLLRVGDATKPELDPAVAIPAAIAARFPQGSYARVGRATDGTYFALVEEGQTGPGTGRHQTALYRLYWLDGDALKRSDAPRVLKGEPSFDREGGAVYLTADNAEVATFEIETGAFKKLAVPGVVADGRDTTFGAIHALAGGRVLLEVTFGEPFERYIYVCDRQGDTLTPRYRAAFFGDFTVESGRFVVGGARQVFVLAAGAEAFHVLLHLPRLSSRGALVLRSRARFYTDAGTIELQDATARWAPVDPTLPRFVGWTGRPAPS